MKLGIDDEVTCFISQYFSINADIAVNVNEYLSQVLANI